MSECCKCGITDFEITPEQIKKYLGEEPDKNILEDQTDKMFFSIEHETICRMCDLNLSELEKCDEFKLYNNNYITQGQLDNLKEKI